MWATLPIDNDSPELCEPTLLPLTPLPNNSDHSRNGNSYRSPPRRVLSCPELSIIDETPSRKTRQHSSSVTFHGFHDHTASRSSSIHHDFPFDDDSHLHTSIKYRHDSTVSTARPKDKFFENSFSLSEISEFEFDTLSNSSNPPSKPNSISPQPSTSDEWVSRLPTDNRIWLDDTNSFLLFLCISILLTHRSYLLKQKDFDAQDIAMHFDRYRRRHNGERLLKCARTYYEQYIQWARKKRMLDDLSSFSAS